jgi:hypothetical protein
VLDLSLVLIAVLCKKGILHIWDPLMGTDKPYNDWLAKQTATTNKKAD